jgi:hypothetical protein
LHHEHENEQPLIVGDSTTTLPQRCHKYIHKPKEEMEDLKSFLLTGM